MEFSQNMKSLNSSVKYEDIPEKGKVSLHNSVSQSSRDSFCSGKNFLSLINSSIYYFTQTAPFSSQYYQSLIRPLEKELSQSFEKQKELIEKLQNTKKNVQLMNVNIGKKEKNIGYFMKKISEIEEDNKKKENQKKNIEFEIQRIKTNRLNSGNKLLAGNTQRRFTVDLERDAWLNEKMHMSNKYSENSDESCIHMLNELESNERHHTYN